MQIFFEGASNPTHRDRLVRAGVQSVSYSFSSLIPRLPKNKPYYIAEHLPDHVEAILHGGTVDAERDDHDYHEFIANNIHRLSLAIEIDHEDYERVAFNREHFWQHVPDRKACPVWKPEHGEDELERLAKEYDWLAVGEPALKDDRTRLLLRRLANQHEVGIHALGTSKTLDLTSMPIDTVNSSSWLSPEKYGELIVWTGHRLKRYPSKYFERGLKRHGQVIEDAGFDMQSVQQQDPEILCYVALWAYMSLEEHFIATTPPVEEPQEDEEEGGQELTHVAKEAAPNAEVIRGDHALLPVFEWGSEQVPEYDEIGQQTGTKSVPKAQVRSKNLMQCDTCFLAGKCPAFKPGNDCAYDIPVSLKTKDDLNQVMSALLEIQSQRAFFGRFSEMLEGGYPDPAVSAEMDRFFKLTEKMKDINDNRDTFEMQVKAKAGAGALSRIFGEKAGMAQRQLDQPLDTNEVVEAIEE